jgi:predicted metal-dependent phosphoesterase TrpH
MEMFKNKDKDSIKVDLHIHTSASDGMWYPDELIRNILDSNINVFSVTDHDTFENIVEVNELCKNTNLVFLPGVEFSTSYANKNYHILGYGISKLTDELIKICKKNKEIFQSIDLNFINYLSDKFSEISIGDFQEYTHDKSLGGWKAYSYCVRKGICKNLGEYLKLFEKTELENPFLNYELSNPKSVIGAIKNANGIAILAHPGASFYEPDIHFVVKYFYSLGIDGFECYHTNNNEKVTQFCLDFCSDNNLIITGGSDCHGDFLKNRMLGNPDIRLSQINLFDRVSKINPVYPL